jgi:hypothetical protein
VSHQREEQDAEERIFKLIERSTEEEVKIKRGVQKI